MSHPILRAVVWDMDGTLVDSATVVPAAFVETVRRLGGPPVTPERVVELYRVGRPRTMLGHMLDRDATDADEDLYHQVLRDRATDVRVHDGVDDALTALADAGLALAVFTGNSSPAAAAILDATALRRHFATVVGGDQVAHAKPAPDGVLEAARRLDVAPAACAYVGDSPLDLASGRAAGARAVAAAWGHLHDAEQVTAADVVASSPAAVVGLLATPR